MSRRKRSPQQRDESGTSIAERMQYLLEHGWKSQRAMSRALGVSQPVISKVVNGERFPGFPMLSRLAAIPGIDIYWVLTGVSQEGVTSPAVTMPDVVLAINILKRHGRWPVEQR